MILTKEKRKEFEVVSRPLIKWIAENLHPHTIVIINSTGSELYEGVSSVHTDEYIPD